MGGKMDEKDDLQVDSEISGNISLPVARTLSIGRHSSLIMELDKVGLGCIIKTPLPLVCQISCIFTIYHPSDFSN